MVRVRHCGGERVVWRFELAWWGVGEMGWSCAGCGSRSGDR